MRLPILIALGIIACKGGDDAEDAGKDGESAARQSMCTAEGWTERPFVTEGVFGHQRRDLADDFTVPTTAGDWTLSTEWSGCESIVFVPDSLIVSPLDETPLISSRKDLKEMLDKSPRNVHWFFVSDATDKQDTNAFVDDMQARIDGAMESIKATDRDWWTPRLHVVTDRVETLDGWLPDAIESGTRGFTIDRFQRIRQLGSLADVTRYDPALNSAGMWPWENNLSYIAHEPQYYNFESDREDELAQTEWTAITLFHDEDLASNGRTTTTVDFPDAATMATFDTMLVDLRHVCDPIDQEWGNCDAWDAVEAVKLCDPTDTTVCDTELARYITTYHREGRWVADSSQLLPFLSDGGPQTLKLEGVRGGHFNTLRILLGNQDKGAVPYAVEELWEGGSWNETYDEDHPPIQVDIPADATRVYLQATISGHGMSQPDNCAEFCDHHHIFTVGGTEFAATHETIDDQEGCLKQVGDGTVPNQYGTWFYNRTSWCPGKEVDPWIWDITDQVVPGQSATLSYRTNWDDPNRDGSIFLRSQIVFWK